MKLGTSAGRIPLNVSVAALASVTAGLANEVGTVNQYAAVMYTPTANGTVDGRRPHEKTEPWNRGYIDIHGKCFAEGYGRHRYASASILGWKES